MSEPAEIGVVDDAEQAAVLLPPLRRRILTLLASPDTAAGVARRLGLPRQLVNYHVRQLEEHGLLSLVEERAQGTRTERVLQARARAFLVAPQALGALGADPERVRDRFSATYLLAVAGRVIRELGAVLARARAEHRRVSTLTLTTQVRFRSAEERAAFAEELTAAVGALVARYHDERAPEGRRFELVLGVYPSADGASTPATANDEEGR